MLLLNIFDTVVLVFVLNALAVNCYSGSSRISKKIGKNRQKRILSLVTDPALNFYFEYNSCYALAVVISLPLEQPPGRSVFFSYNFETNYYYAYFDNAQGLTPVPFTYIDQPGANLGTKNRVVLPPAYRQFNDNAEDEKLVTEQNKTEMSENKPMNKSLANDSVILNLDIKEEIKSSKKNQSKEEKAKIRKIRTILQNYFMSRRRFYKMMESKMDSSGMKGSDCILKAICETSADSFEQHNGVIGSVVDVLFLPSASKDETLPKRYYRAEANGKLRNCSVYDKACPKSLFDFISKII